MVILQVLHHVVYRLVGDHHQHEYSMLRMENESHTHTAVAADAVEHEIQ